MKILVAMSGGVDSSVAAALLRAEGHDVTGVHMKLSSVPAAPDASGRIHGCCTVEAADDARRVAQMVDIPFYVWDLTAEFGAGVMQNFVDEYASGRTPNPCVRCNETVKFGALLDRGRRAGFDAVATGHYAISRFERGAWRLFRSADAAKDQSYVLATLGQDELAFARFPVGERTKATTRALARSIGLRTADKPDSYEICFVPDGDAGAFVDRALGGARPGDVVDPDGAVLGEHRGLQHYTVGQRRGLGVATHEKRFVLELDPARNRIVVGPGELLSRSGFIAERVSWVAEAPDLGTAVTVQIRAHGTPVDATIERLDGTDATIRFSQNQRGVAPGQLAAFYSGDEVVGAGTIARSFA